MARFGASLFALVCTGLVVGLLAIPVIAQDADEPPPRVYRPKARKKAPIVPVRGEDADRDAPPAADREAPAGEDRESPAERNEQREPRRPRGEVAPLRLPTIAPEMLKVLQDWELHSSQYKTLYGSVERRTLDWTFQTQKNAEGTFAYRAPDQGIFKMTGLPVPAGGANGVLRSNPETGRKVQFQMAEDKQEHWICTGKELFNIDHQTKTLEKLIIPPQHRGQGIMETPLPFLFGMKVKQARARYDMKLLTPKTPKPDEIWLSAKPLWATDAANYKEAKVILSRATFLPIAVQLTNPAGTSETLYQFHDLRTKTKFLEKDPFAEPLPPYKQVQTARGGDAKPGPAAGRAPAGARR